MPTINVDGRSIFFREFGAAELPTMVLVHGLYGDSGSVVPLAEAFARDFT